jgi:Tol biopolymer transport system component
MGLPGEIVAGLRWSLDGRWLTYAAILPGMINKVFRTDLQTGDTSEVAGTSGVSEGNLTSDGKRVYYRGRAGAVVRELATGTETVVVEGSVVKTALSPDEKWLAVHQRVAASNSHTVGLVPTTGGDVKPLFQAPADSFLFTYVNWSADSRRVFVVESKPGKDRHYVLWSIPVDGQRPSTIDLGAIAPSAGFSVHPDGKSVVLTNSKPEPREIWAVENFLPASKPAPKAGSVK